VAVSVKQATYLKCVCLISYRSFFPPRFRPGKIDTTTLNLVNIAVFYCDCLNFSDLIMFNPAFRLGDIEDVLKHVFLFIGDDYEQFITKAYCRFKKVNISTALNARWYLLFQTTLLSDKLKSVTTFRAASTGDLPIFKWVMENKSARGNELLSYAALGGDMQVLQWARNNGCNWHTQVCSNAAKKATLRYFGGLGSMGAIGIHLPVTLLL
jgi:hypothetical protein